MGGLAGSAVWFVLSLVGLSCGHDLQKKKKRRIVTGHTRCCSSMASCYQPFITRRFFSLTCNDACSQLGSPPRWAFLPPSRRCCGCRGGLMLPYRGEQLIVRLELIIERPLRRIARAVRLEVVDDIRK